MKEYAEEADFADEHSGDDTDPKKKKDDGSKQATDLASANELMKKILSEQGSAPDVREDGPAIRLPNFNQMRQGRELLDSDKVKELEKKYGVPPHAYAGLFDAPMEHNEDGLEKFLVAIRRVTNYINQKLADQKAPYRFTQAQIATNFLAEGGILYLRGSKASRGSVKYFTASGVGEVVEVKGAKYGVDKLLPDNFDNKDGELETAMMGNAAFFASMASHVIQVMGKPAWDALPPEGKFFWTTVEYNTVPGALESMIRSKGPESWKLGWKGTDSHADNKMLARFNASWRTALDELLTPALGFDTDPNHKTSESKDLIGFAATSLSEALDLCEAMWTDAQKLDCDERQVQDFLYLEREIDTRFTETPTDRWNPNSYKKAEARVKLARANAKTAAEQLAQRHGLRGAKWKTYMPVLSKFYDAINARVSASIFPRNMPRMDLMTNAQYLVEWGVIESSLEGYDALQTEPGYKYMQAFAEDAKVQA